MNWELRGIVIVGAIRDSMPLQIIILQSSKLVVAGSPGRLALGASANLWVVVDTEGAQV